MKHLNKRERERLIRSKKQLETEITPEFKKGIEETINKYNEAL
ncbi:hypothetical protein [Sporolactobacillus shoreae]|nr:hypothetical protein [Sporolactobacillus shoreae]